MLTLADIEITERKLKLETQKIRQLISDYKKFTLPNRNRLKELEKRAAKSMVVNDRTKRAIAGRKLNQQRAEEILQYQITIATAGIPTQHISDLWRARYGTDPRSESESEDQEIAGLL
jgi:transcription antitermination factor NusA-like protein